MSKGQRFGLAHTKICALTLLLPVVLDLTGQRFSFGKESAQHLVDDALSIKLQSTPLIGSGAVLNE